LSDQTCNLNFSILKNLSLFVHGYDRYILNSGWNNLSYFPVQVDSFASVGDIDSILTFGGKDFNNFHNLNCYEFQGICWFLNSTIPVGVFGNVGFGTPLSAFSLNGITTNNNDFIESNLILYFNGSVWEVNNYTLENRVYPQILSSEISCVVTGGLTNYFSNKQFKLSTEIFNGTYSIVGNNLPYVVAEGTSIGDINEGLIIAGLNNYTNENNNIVYQALNTTIQFDGTYYSLGPNTLSKRYDLGGSGGYYNGIITGGSNDLTVLRSCEIFNGYVFSYTSSLLKYRKLHNTKGNTSGAYTFGGKGDYLYLYDTELYVTTTYISNITAILPIQLPALILYSIYGNVIQSSLNIKLPKLFNIELFGLNLYGNSFINIKIPKYIFNFRVGATLKTILNNIKLSATGKVGIKSTLNISLPKYNINFYQGSLLKISLPILNFSLVGEYRQDIKSNLNIKISDIKFDSFILTGIKSNLNISFVKSIKLDAKTSTYNYTLFLYLPDFNLSINASNYININANINFNLPNFYYNFSSFNSVLSDLNIKLPYITFSSRYFKSEIANITLDLPNITYNSLSLVEILSNLSSILPDLYFNSKSYDTYPYNIDFSLPSLSINFIMHSNYINIIGNLISRFSDIHFNSFGTNNYIQSINADINLELKSPTINLYAIRGIASYLDITIPSLNFVEPKNKLTITLSSLDINMHAIHGIASYLNINIPNFDYNFGMYPLINSDLNLNIFNFDLFLTTIINDPIIINSMMRFSLYKLDFKLYTLIEEIFGNLTFNINLDFFDFELLASLDQITQINNYKTIVINYKNSAISEYSNLKIDSACVYNDEVYFVDNGNINKLTNNYTNPVSGSFLTGSVDLFTTVASFIGTRRLNPEFVYAEATKPFNLIIRQNNKQFIYNPNKNISEINELRFEIGKGFDSKFIKIGGMVTNSTSKIIINKLELTGKYSYRKK
jgi:hypothetical protein